MTGVATQGDPSSDKWVKTYLISYSYDSSSWRNYKLEQKDVPGKVFIECLLDSSIVQYEAMRSSFRVPIENASVLSLTEMQIKVL